MLASCHFHMLADMREAGFWGGVHARLHVGMFSTIMRERSEFNSPLERQRDRFPTRFFFFFLAKTKRVKKEVQLHKV